MAAIQVRSIRPDITDNRIKTFNSESHYIVIPESSNQRNLLLVHLSASFSRPSESSEYLQLAAREGYHVISLSYPGIDNMFSSCEHSTDPPCYENFHRELAEGKNYTNSIAIDSFESIFFRLQRVLDYLIINYPDENWSYFLDNKGNMLTTRMIWSGHSDGAGHAAVISKYYPVHRVICFSGPKDFSLHYYLPPVWVHTGEWKTDKSRIYGFTHTGDEYLFQKEIWDSMGLNRFGPPVNVTVQLPPYSGSHQLITSTAVSIADVHGSTVVDTRSPKAADKYIFEPVWKYLLDIGSTTPLSTQGLISFSITPNPVYSGGLVTIKSETQLKNLELLDCTGKKVNTIIEKVFRINPGLNAGVYFIRGWVGHQAVFSRLIVY
jgi:hypothetical protein